MANHSLTVTDGNVSGNVLYVAYKPSGQGKGNAELVHLDTYEQTGGTVSVQRLVTSYAGKNSEETSGRADTEINISGGLLDVAGNVELSYNRMWSGLTSTVNVSGGRLAVGGNMRLINYNGGVYAPAGILNVTGGEVDVAGVVDLSRTKNQAASTKQSGIRLHGGLLKAGNVIQTTNDCPYASFYFNGGTYAPYGATAANRTMQGLNAAYVSTNGAVISTAYLPAGETYEIAQALLADPALGGATDGGLVKKGAGTLALSGANTYTGRTVVEAGTLAVANAAALTGDLTVANGALLDATGIDLALSKIRASGVVAARSLSVSGAIELAADGSVLSVDGDLALVRGVTIDFGALDEAPAGRVAVAAVSGNVAIPDLVRARNSGSDTRCQMEVEDGILYANPTTTAFVMVIR